MQRCRSGTVERSKDGRIRFLEEHFVQRSHRFWHVLFFNHEAHVDFACTLADHAYVHVLHRGKHLACNAVVPANILAHHAHQRLVALVLHVGNALQVGRNRRQPIARVHRHADGHLACADHVDRHAVLVEHVEHGFQIAVRHQHATRHDVHNR